MILSTLGITNTSMAKPIEFNLFAPYNKGAALVGSFF